MKNVGLGEPRRERRVLVKVSHNNCSISSFCHLDISGCGECWRTLGLKRFKLPFFFFYIYFAFGFDKEINYCFTWDVVANIQGEINPTT